MQQEQKETQWTLVLWLQAAQRDFRDSWKQLPKEAWQSWLVTLTIGWCIAAGFVLLLVWFVRSPARTGLRAQEAQLLQTILDTRPISLISTNWLNIIGHPLYLILIIGVVLSVAIYMGRPLEGLTILLAFLMVTLLVGIGWFTWSRERPNMVLNGVLAPGLRSFPSGHVAQGATIYGLLAYFWIRHSRHKGEHVLAVCLMGFTIATIAVGRLWIGSHWPSDVVASLLIAALWVSVLIVALRRADRQIHARTSPTPGPSSRVRAVRRIMQ